MSQAVTTTPIHQNVWWGIGLSVASQAVVLGVNTMIVRMFALNNDSQNCLIRVSGVQAGPGLGGGGDGVLVIATGVAAPAMFALIKVDNGWDFSLRDVVDVTKTPGSIFQLARLIKTVPAEELLDFTVTHPAYLLKLKDAVGAFYDTASVSAGAIMDRPHLWSFPVFGVGFELALTYNFGSRIELVQL